jgi:cytochrome P450
VLSFDWRRQFHENRPHSNSILALLQHPEQNISLKAMTPSIENAIEEYLRFDSPALAIRRLILEDIEIKKKLIKKGSVLNADIRRSKP